MKTKYKYIEFIPGFASEGLPGMYTEWICRNKGRKTVLGIVSYEEPWKEWEFCPYARMGFTIECLVDIADFLRQLNAEGKPA